MAETSEPTLNLLQDCVQELFDATGYKINDFKDLIGTTELSELNMR